MGLGEHTFHALNKGRLSLPKGGKSLTEYDASAFFVHRIMNLRKLFPWIPSVLNDILMHFSFGTSHFYESVEEILEDLRPVAASLGRESSRGGTGVSA